MTAVNGETVPVVTNSAQRTYDYVNASPEALEEEAYRRLVANERAAARRAREKADEAGVRPFVERLFTPSQAMTATPPEPLINGTVDAQSTTMLIGVRGTGKTFVATDMALSIATGTMWANRTVTQGRVLFIVGEGGQSAYGIRIEAWLKHHGIALGDLDSRMKMVEGAVPFMSSQWEELVQFVEQWRPSLVVLDTLARHQIGLEENSNSDAADALAKAEMLQARGAAVLILHHPPGSRTGGVNASRGATGWEGGVDSVFTLEDADDDDAPGVVRLTCTKQKHRPDGDVWDFRQLQVSVGNPTWPTSIVMVQVDPLAAQKAVDADKLRALEAERVGLEASFIEYVRAQEPDTVGEIDAWAAENNLSRDKIRDVSKRLAAAHRITYVHGLKGPRSRGVRVVDDPAGEASPADAREAS